MFREARRNLALYLAPRDKANLGVKLKECIIIACLDGGNRTDKWRSGSSRKKFKSFYLGQGQEFRGEGILAVTKALLQSGVSYVAGYQGAPISHLMDVLTDANDILEELGVHFRTQRFRSYCRRHSRRFRELSFARRRHIQIHRRHECRV